MSRLLGPSLHQAYVFPDFDAAIDRFAAGGIGPFYVIEEAGGMGIYRGEEHPLSIKVAFFYTGDTCIEILSPKTEQKSAYAEFLSLNPNGGLHHIAYHSDDFAATLAMLEAEGKPLQTVQEFRHPANGETIEIYCEPVGVENPILFQFIKPGLFDPWFEAMRQAAAAWNGKDPIRDARPLMAASMSEISA